MELIDDRKVIVMFNNLVPGAILVGVFPVQLYVELFQTKIVSEITPGAKADNPERHSHPRDSNSNSVGTSGSESRSYGSSVSASGSGKSKASSGSGVSECEGFE